MSNLVKTKSSTFSQLFNKKYYKIPKFQRTFAWRKEHVNDFWEDLSDSMDSNKNHFFGSIVLQIEKRSGNNIVYDGQQRLTVVIALISLITYKLREINTLKKDDDLNALIAKITRKYIYNKNLHPYLTLTYQNKEYFTKCLLEPDEYLQNKISKKSNEFLRIYVFRNLKTHIEDRLQQYKDESEKIQYLKNFLSFICNKIYFAVIFTDKHFPAATLFEVLNFRGAVLKPSDLIKNLIYSKAEEQRCYRKVDMLWNDYLEKIDVNYFNDFLKHFWILISGYPLKGSLYKTMKRYLNKQANMKLLELIKKMGKYIVIYVDILKPKGKARWRMHQDIEESLLAISKLNAKVCYPLLLSVFSLDVQPEEKLEFNKTRRRLLSTIENIFFRLMVCNKEIPYELEKLCAEFSKKIRKTPIKELNELIRSIKQFSPDDRTFEYDFSTLIAPYSISVYILHKLENYLRGNRERLTSKVTIEHIMPKTVGHRGWGSVGRYHKNYLNRLGNLTLLSKGLNKGNQSFAKKKDKFYKESTVNLTKSLVVYPKWNKAAIIQRQKEMASKAISLWTSS
jgi:hypothetical protein